MIRRMARQLVWVLLLAAIAPAARAANSDEWRLSDVRDYDYYWFRTPPRLITPREIERLADCLDLTDTQRNAFAALALSAQREFEDGWLDMAESFDDLRYGADARHDRDWRARRRRTRDLHHRSQAALASARTGILSDLQLLLTEEQAAAWDDALRAHRRRTTLAEYANTNGETVDLISIVELIDTLTDEQRTAIEKELDGYVIDLDAALSARHAARRNLERACRKLDDSRMSEKQATKDELQGLTDDVIHHALRTWEASRRIREINDRYATLVGDLLGETERQELKELTADAPLPGGEFRAMPRGQRMLTFAEHLDTAADVARAQVIYGRSRWYSLMAAAAQGIEPLTQEQRDKIAALREQFEADYDQLRRRYDVPDVRTYNDNYIAIHSDEGRVELQRKKNVDSRSKAQDWSAYYQDLGRLSDDVVEKLRKVLTVRQRILLQTRE